MPTTAVTQQHSVPASVVDRLTTIVQHLTGNMIHTVNDLQSEVRNMHSYLQSRPIEVYEYNKVIRKVTFMKNDFEIVNDLALHSQGNQLFDMKSLEMWQPDDDVLQENKWNKMRLVLNKLATENNQDVYLGDWIPSKPFSPEQQQNLQILMEVMTSLDEIHSFLQFQRSTQHHVMVGNINMTQIEHFLIMMTYMSFCRSSHCHAEYTTTDVNTINAYNRLSYCDE